MSPIQGYADPAVRGDAAGAGICVAGIRKAFGPTVALDDLSLTIARGESHAILGENGAGKSTLVKLLSGLVQPDTGEIAILGHTVRLATPKAAHELGLRTAFQEISLVRDLTVAQNFMLMEEPLTAFGTVRRRRAEAMVRETLVSLGVEAIDPRRRVADLDLATRQKIEIARAVSRRPKILLLDEPTASLSAHDVAWLARLIADLKEAGTTIVLISHRMQDVRDFCETMTILRNGRAVGTHRVEALSDSEVIALMIGRSLDVVFPPRVARAPSESWAPTALACEEFETEGAGPVSFDLRPGEILGVAALQGMGQRELFLGLFGAQPATGGVLRVRNVEARFRSPADAVEPRWGLGLVPEDRKTEGLFLDLDGRENAALPSLARFIRGGLVKARQERTAVSAALAVVQVAARALWTPVRQFSGGNQQKIVLAKWLLTGAPVLLLFDPTRGVDVGTKAEMYRLMREYADEGGAILFHTTDIAELVNLCDRVLVLYRGRIATALAGSDLTDAAIMHAAVGQGVGEMGRGHGRH